MKKKMYFLINSLEGGGAERVVVNLARELTYNHDVAIITLKDSVFYDIPNGVRHITLSKTTSNIVMLLLFPLYIRRFKRLLKREGFDTGISLLELSNFVHILSKKSAIISLRNSIGSFRGINGSIYRCLIKQLYPKASKIIVNSEQNRHLIAEYLHYDIDRIDVLYNPINLEDGTILRKKPLDDEILKKIAHKTVFITVARLVRQKYHETLIKSMTQITNKDRIYLIIGDGPRRSSLEVLVKLHNLQDHIIFLGQQSNVFKYLDKADYFVYASAYEGFPNVLIEAMSCDLPIITSDFVSGAQEVIFGNYDKNRDLTYPSYGPNGVLLDIAHYEENRLQVMQDLDRVKQQKKGFERFIKSSHTEDVLS